MVTATKHSPPKCAFVLTNFAIELRTAFGGVGGKYPWSWPAMKLYSLNSRGMAALSISIPAICKPLQHNRQNQLLTFPASFAFLNPNGTKTCFLRMDSPFSFSSLANSTWRCEKQVVKANRGYGDNAAFSQGVKYPRPEEVPWQKELANNVHLIGVLGQPVQIKYLKSGKAFAWTNLGVKKSAKSTETVWIALSFWDELAETATQHMNKGDLIYVSGRLVSDMIVEADEKPRTFYKVVVSSLNFVENKFPSYTMEMAGNLKAHLENKTEQAMSSSSSKRTQQDAANRESLWQTFFANPFEWWDNRTNKRNPNYPDFKHKDTGEALWVEGRDNPSWVKSQLAILDSRMKASQQWDGSQTSARPLGSPSTFQDTDFRAT